MKLSTSNAAQEQAAPTAGAATRERLRQVALDLFWEKSYRKTGTRDLAAALGVKQASLYYHVRNKEELLYDICFSSLEYVIAQVEAVMAQAAEPMQTLEAVARTHMVATLARQREFIVSMYDYRSLSPDCNLQINGFWSRYEQRMTELYDAAIAAGTMRSGLPHKYHYHAIMSMTNWPILWFRAEGELTADALAAQFAKIYCTGAVAPGCNLDLSLFGDALAEPPASQLPICETRNETHARLLDVASMLFATRGYTTTSIREVAEAMQIEKPSLYYYTKSKDDLCYQIIRSAHEHMLASVRRALVGVTRVEGRLLRFITAHVCALLEHKHWFAVANEQINFLAPAHRAETVALRDQHEQLLREILVQAQQQGVLRTDVDARHLGFALLGIITHIYPWYQEESDLPPRALAELLADFFLHGIQARSAS